MFGNNSRRAVMLLPHGPLHLGEGNAAPRRPVMACIFQVGIAIKGESQPEIVAAKGPTSGHYIDILRSGPNLKDYFRRLTIEEQMEMVRTFIPTDPRLTFSPVRRCRAFGVGSHRSPHQREQIVHVVQAGTSKSHTIFRRKKAFYGNN
jgi:hypothetical protein